MRKERIAESKKENNEIGIEPRLYVGAETDCCWCYYYLQTMPRRIRKMAS